MLRNEPIKPFRFNNRGNTAVIGRHAAVFDFGTWTLTGWFAWIMWAIVHVALLVGFENRIAVTLHWFWSYLTFESGARLIATSKAGREEKASVPAARGVGGPVEVGARMGGEVHP
jgi:NADH dehydrogenase